MDRLIEMLIVAIFRPLGPAWRIAQSVAEKHPVAIGLAGIIATAGAACAWWQHSVTGSHVYMAGLPLWFGVISSITFLLASFALPAARHRLASWCYFLVFVVLLAMSSVAYQRVSRAEATYAANAERLFGQARQIRWVAFDPTGYDPFSDLYPQAESLREDLRVLRRAGFDGVITFGTGGTLCDIPRIAKTECGFRAAIMGVYDLRGSEVERAASYADHVDAYCVGDVALDKLYSEKTLLKMMRRLRRRTLVPVTTTELLSRYDSHVKLLEESDFLLPDVHVAWDNCTAEDILQRTKLKLDGARRLSEMSGGKVVLAKMIACPSRGRDGAGYSEEYQAQFWREVLEHVHHHNGVVVTFFAGFDISWKQRAGWPVEECYVGLFDDARNQKPAVGTLQELWRAGW